MTELESSVSPGRNIAVPENYSSSLLEDAITATKKTEKDIAKELISTLVDEATKNTVVWDKNLTLTINKAISEIDKLVSSQLAQIMHNEQYQKLEGSWRGLQYLVKNSNCNSTLKIKVLQAEKKELAKDLAKANEFDQSSLFKKIYEEEFGMAGGEPFGAMIGDYEITNHQTDINFIKDMSGIAASAFCPFITSPAPELFGLENWQELSKPRDLSKIFESVEYASFKSFRNSEDSRFVTFTMPRTLSRLPFGDETNPIEAFKYEEFAEFPDGTPIPHNNYSWMNASYVMGTKITNAFTEHGWCTAIRGTEGGGKVEGLPTHIFTSDDGDKDLKCPTEIGITDRREAELSKLGFLPLCHYKNTDFAVFFGGQTTQLPKKYDQPDATANAAISARLPYLMAVSRISHYLKVMARDKIGSYYEASDMQILLNKWVDQYVNSNPNSSHSDRAKYPLAAARIDVVEIPGEPGCYNAIAYLRPWLQFEELTTSMRLVAKLPAKSN